MERSKWDLSGIIFPKETFCSEKFLYTGTIPPLLCLENLDEPYEQGWSNFLGKEKRNSKKKYKNHMDKISGALSNQPPNT